MMSGDVFINLPPGFNMDLDRIRVIDAGNISTKGLTLEEVHCPQEAVCRCCLTRRHPAGDRRRTRPYLPGPCRVGKGSGAQKDSLGLINVDSHLDVRTDENGINSGTSFYRALTQLPNKALSGNAFVEFAIQEPYNSLTIATG